MKLSTLWALILLVLWVVPGCSSAESENTATIVIAKGNSFLFQTGQNEPGTYEDGDTVFVELEGDTCYVDGQPYWPPPRVAPTVFPVEMLEDMYGRVPLVVEYLRTHTGDETELWNEAYRQWAEQRRLLGREVVRQYMSDLRSGKTGDEAAEAALATFRASPLVSSARVDESTRRADTQGRTILMYWAGETDETGFRLDPHIPLDVPPPRPMTLERFKDFVGMLRILERKGPVRIELEGGNLVLTSGPEALERGGDQ